MASVRSYCSFLLLAAVAGLNSGCSTETYSAGANRTADQRLADFKANPDQWAKLGYKRDWTGFPAITGSLPVQFILPGPDAIAVLEAGSQLSILDTATGNRRAASELANPLTRFVGLERDGDRVYAMSEAEVFTVDVQTGILRDRKHFEKIVSTQPARFGNLLICGSPSGEVMAHAATGAIGGVKTWGFGTGGAITRKPVLIGDIVGTVSQSGAVVFLDAATGGLQGRNSIYKGIEVDPVSDGTAMYVAGDDQSVYGFSPQGGSMLWQYRTPHALRVQPTAHAGRLYCSIPGEGLVAFDGPTGNVLWRCKGFSDGVVVAINRNRLLAFNGKQAALIDPDRGDILESVDLPGVRILKPDSFVDGDLYVVSESGVVAKYLRR